MPPRNQKEYQVVVKDEDHLESLLDSEPKKLSVVDVHLSWCGACTLLGSTFRSIALRIEEWESRIQFLIADVDKIASLKDHQNSCKPKFLFYLGSKHIATVEGANVPEINTLINKHIPSLESD